MYIKDFEFNYRDDNTNFLTELILKSEKKISYCTCGYISPLQKEVASYLRTAKNQPDKSIKECPNCKTTKRTISTMYTYHLSSRDQIKKTFLKECKLTTEGVYFELYSYRYNSIINKINIAEEDIIKAMLKEKGEKVISFRDTRDEFYINKQYNFKQMKPEKIIKITLKYKENKKTNKIQLSKEMLVNDVKYTFNKSTLWEQLLGDNIYIQAEIFNKLALFSNLNYNVKNSKEYIVVNKDIIWDVYNFYNLLKDLIKEGYMGLTYYSIKDCKSFIELLNSKEIKKIIKEDLKNKNKQINVNEYLDIQSDVKQYFLSFENKSYSTLSEKEKTRYYIDRLNKKEFVKNNISQYEWNKAYINYMTKSGATEEEILKLLDIMNRQNIDITDTSKIFNLARGVEIFKQFGLSFDKTPKELMIYLNKIELLKKLHTELNKESVYDIDIEGLEEYEYIKGLDIIKIAYELKNNYSLIDKILYESLYNLQEKRIPIMIRNKKTREIYKDFIIFGEKSTSYVDYNFKDKMTPKKIFLKDKTIEGEKNINKIITEYFKLENKKEERELAIH